jgi:predicted TIM-barrel fold metal-dependent hydrolase
MRIDAWTHFLSPAYVRQLERESTQGRGSFFLAQRALHDLGFRLRLIDDQGDYRQVLTPMPAPLVFDAPALSAPVLTDVVRRNNDELAEITERHADRFARIRGRHSDCRPGRRHRGSDPLRP